VSGLRLFSLQFFRMAVDVVSFFFYARAETMTPQGLKATAKLTLGEWLAARGFSEDFSRLFMLPTMAAVCTCSYDAVLNYPADLVLVYLRDKLHVGVVRATNGFPHSSLKLFFLK
jgi:predicted NAD/FAD-binding protein